MKNPLENLENDQEPLVEEESNLQDYTAPANGEAGVMGDEQNADPSYLKTAQKLWEKGVEARNAENLELANEYFNQAKIFVEAYESNAVSDFYTVTWREVNTDCLWRISSYDFIYDNPFPLAQNLEKKQKNNSESRSDLPWTGFDYSP
jgi:hypothetical protein